MNSNDILRKECRLLKATQQISYKEIAEYLEVNPESFYSWIRGCYNFGLEKQDRLKTVLIDLKE